MNEGEKGDWVGSEIRDNEKGGHRAKDGQTDRTDHSSLLQSSLETPPPLPLRGKGSASNLF